MPGDPALRRVRWELDRLREPFAPRQTPRPAPAAGVFDPPYRCVLVNESWISHIAGMVDVLTEPDSWSGDDLAQYTARQQIESFLRALTLGNCVMGITDIRVNGCKLEVEYNDSGEWTEIGDLTACAVPGPPGQDGQDGASVELRYIDKGGGEWWVQWRQDDDDPTWADLFRVPEGGIPGPPGQDGASVELRVFGGWIQWRQDDNDPTWSNLFPVPQDGAPGEPGEDGASVELQVWEFTEVGMPHYGETWLQWRRVGDSEWQNLIDLADLQGEPGEDGASVELQVWEFTEVGMPHYGETWLQWRRVGDSEWQNLVNLADLQGEPGEDGAPVEFQVWEFTEVGMPHYGETWLQWRHVGDSEWENLLNLAELKGDPGEDGAPGLPGAPGADGASVELRVFGGWIQWRQDDNDPTWTNLVELEDLRGPPGYTISDPGPPPTSENPEEAWCGAVRYVCEAIDSAFNDWLDDWSATMSIAELEGGLVGALAAWFGPLGLLWNGFTALITGLNETQIALIRADLDSEFWQRVRCLAFSDRPTDNYITQSWLDLWATGVEALTSTWQHGAWRVAELMRAVPLENWRKGFWIGSLAPSALCAPECSEYGEYEWSHLFVFNSASGLQGWMLQAGILTTTGLLTTPYSGFKRAGVTFQLPPGSVVTQMESHGYRDTDTPGNTLLGWVGGEGVEKHAREYYRSRYDLFGDGVELVVSTDMPNQPANGYLYSVTVRGLGPDPFVS